MFKGKKLLVGSLLMMGLVADSTMASNGANLIGLDPNTRALGGVGIGSSPGIGSITKNPAWLTQYEGYQFLLGATTMFPDSRASVAVTGVVDSNGYQKSDGTFYALPKISIVNQLDKDWVLGLDLEAAAGFGVDHKTKAALSNVLTNMLYARFTPSIGHKIDDNWSVGAGLHAGYSLLDMNANLAPATAPTDNQRRGGGTSTAVGFGYKFGVGYEQVNWSVGASYGTPVKLAFDNVADLDANGSFEDLTFEMPTEYGIGGSYAYQDWTFNLDYKHLAWSNAEGFGDFQWDDQDVIGIGASWQVNDKMIVRFGGSFADSPIQNRDDLSNTKMLEIGGVMLPETQVAALNLTGVPGIAEQTFGIGLGYEWSSKFRSDFSLTYTPEVKITQSGSTVIPSLPATLPTEFSATLENVMFSAAMTWAFD